MRLLSPVTTKRGELQDDLAFGNMTQRREIARPRTVKFKSRSQRSSLNTSLRSARSRPRQAIAPSSYPDKNRRR